MNSLLWLWLVPAMIALITYLLQARLYRDNGPSWRTIAGYTLFILLWPLVAAAGLISIVVEVGRDAIAVARKPY